MDGQPHTYAVTAKGIDGLALQLDRKTIQAASGEIVGDAGAVAGRAGERAAAAMSDFTLTA